MTTDLFDFRSPPPLAEDLSRRLEQWFAEAARKAGKTWGPILNGPVRWQYKGPQLVSFQDCAGRIPPEAVCYRVALGVDDTLSLVVLPRPIVLVLLGQALG